MHLPKYHLKAEKELTRFEFISEGPKGLIRKIVAFQATTNPDVFNLAFGDKDPITGEIDDLAVSDNGDHEKVLATVVAALYAFLNKYPEVFVYAVGSTAARTRLYRIGIAKFYAFVEEDFYLYGQVGNEFVSFERGKAYDGFLVQRKF